MAFKLGDDLEASSDFKGPLLGLRQFLNIESPLKVMENVFLFDIKNSFCY